eukprot:s3142_g3.t1
MVGLYHHLAAQLKNLVKGVLCRALASCGSRSDISVSALDIFRKLSVRSPYSAQSLGNPEGAEDGSTAWSWDVPVGTVPAGNCRQRSRDNLRGIKSSTKSAQRQRWFSERRFDMVMGQL